MPWNPPKTNFANGDVLAASEMNAIGQNLAMFNGGTTGQVLAKTGSADGAWAWTSETDPNAIPKTLIDAKGDLIAGTAADTAGRLAVGTNGQVLTADSSTGTGLAWSTISAGGMTLITTTTLSASTGLSFTSIPTTYRQLKIVYRVEASNSTTEYFSMDINGDTGSNYGYMGMGNTTTNTAISNKGSGGNTTRIGWDKYDAPITCSGNTTGRFSVGVIDIYNANSTTLTKPFAIQRCGYDGSYDLVFATTGSWSNTNAVSSVTFTRRGGTISMTGAAYLYGIS